MNKQRQGVGVIRSLSRREFLHRAALSGGGIMLAATGCGELLVPKGSNIEEHLGPLIFIAIDALHPAYLSLDADGHAGGHDGSWLMPNVRRFLDRATWYPNAKDYLPSATDMNHLNALAGTCSAQTGLISVCSQVVGWHDNGEPVTVPPGLSFARDDQGRPVDTLFHAWKRAWPDSTTAFISGKGWVAEMFRSSGAVDVIATGESHPDYISAPDSHDFSDPPTDMDGTCDPESVEQAGGILALMIQGMSDQFPSDAWIVDATLSIFEREAPQMAYVLLAQVDDTGHLLGAAWDPDEFADKEPAYVTPEGCDPVDDYQLVSRANRALFREPILDAIRDTDEQFGRLMVGLESQEVLDDATVILLSDHSMVTHLQGVDWDNDNLGQATDYYRLILYAGLGDADNVKPFSACSVAMVYWRDDKECVPDAKQLLESHTAINPRTGEHECPWWVLDRQDMKAGKQGVSLPGELYHEWFVDLDMERTMVWPDLIILAKNGWQLPIYGSGLANLGIMLDGEIGPLWNMMGGHGSVDTQPIVMAIATPLGSGGQIEREVRIADLAVTAAARYGLQLQSTTIGLDLSSDLG